MTLQLRLYFSLIKGCATLKISSFFSSKIIWKPVHATKAIICREKYSEQGRVGKFEKLSQ